MQAEVLKGKAEGYGIGGSIGLVWGILLLLALHRMPTGDVGVGYTAEQMLGLAGMSLVLGGAFAALEAWRVGRARAGRGSWSGPLFPGIVTAFLSVGALSAAMLLFL